VLVAFGALFYFGLSVAGLGGLAAFVSHPPLMALFGVYLALSTVALFAGGNLSRGIREARQNRWVIWALVVVALADAYVPAWTDRRNLWTLDGDAVRWLGVLLVAYGGTLRIVPVFILGNRFSGLAAIQPEHALVTTGLYATIRHPSYLGLLIGALGWNLCFRSGIGVLLSLLFVIPIVARMNAEEALLRSYFGEPYDTYRAKTRRLIPGVY
jgi:protein-S-isoprenylcysteine O-methyltransferase Ste14